MCPGILAHLVFRVVPNRSIFHARALDEKSFGLAASNDGYGSFQKSGLLLMIEILHHLIYM